MVPTKMKISLSLFIVTHTKLICLKRRINFLSNHGTNRFWRRKFTEYFYGSWSLKIEKVQEGEVLAMKVISLESLHAIL